MDQGEIHLGPFLYSDLAGSKRRPLCILSGSRYNSGPDVMVAMISRGNTHRMRLHRGGDRRANMTPHMTAPARLRLDPETKIYMEGRHAEGLSKRDIIRCLKRFIAREVFQALKRDLH